MQWARNAIKPSGDDSMSTVQESASELFTQEEEDGEREAEIPFDINNLDLSQVEQDLRRRTARAARKSRGKLSSSIGPNNGLFLLILVPGSSSEEPLWGFSYSSSSGNDDSPTDTIATLDPLFEHSGEDE